MAGAAKVTDLPLVWPVRVLELNGCIVRDRITYRLIVEWNGGHPVVKMKDGSLLKMPANS